MWKPWAPGPSRPCSPSAPGDTPLEFVADLARGINERVTDYDAELVGGDVTDNDRITIAVTGIGQLGGSLPPLRLDQARPGQILVASGHIGYSAAGYALLKNSVARVFRPNSTRCFAPTALPF